MKPHERDRVPDPIADDDHERHPAARESVWMYVGCPLRSARGLTVDVCSRCMPACRWMLASSAVRRRRTLSIHLIPSHPIPSATSVRRTARGKGSRVCVHVVWCELSGLLGLSMQSNAGGARLAPRMRTVPTAQYVDAACVSQAHGFPSHRSGLPVARPTRQQRRIIDTLEVGC